MIDEDEQQLREVEDELEDEELAFEVNEMVEPSIRSKPEPGRYSDANQQLKRAQTQSSALKQPTSVNSSVTSISGQGGLRKPTQISVKTGSTTANTSSNYASTNGINGHGISGSKIQNKFGPESSKDANPPSLMGKFGRKDEP